MINFDDTAVAFKSKSNNELIRSYWLFKIIGSKKLVKIGKTLTLFALKIKLPIKSIIRATIFKQFCGGETVDQCTPTIKIRKLESLTDCANVFNCKEKQRQRMM